MYHPLTAAPIPAIVFTDLDGTLLDHHSYSFEPAKPALERLKQLGVPLVIVTSKTIAEVAELREEIGNQHPFIVENGAGLIYPEGCSGGESLESLPDGGHIKRFSPTYQEIREKIREWRHTYNFKFEGFGDWDELAVAKHTGLDPHQSALAKKRVGSEPFLWQDTAENFARFQQLVKQSNLNCILGGRFYHLLGHTDKARAASELLEQYKNLHQFDPTVIALGDSPNDIALLHIADVAVVIRKHDDTHMKYEGLNTTIYTQGQGPTGWNEALQPLLTQLENDDV